VVVTDLQESGWDVGDRASVPESARIEVVDVGAAPANLAVTSLRLVGDRLVASLRHTDAKPRETRVRLTLDGRAAGETTVAAGADGRRLVSGRRRWRRTARRMERRTAQLTRCGAARLDARPRASRPRGARGVRARWRWRADRSGSRNRRRSGGRCARRRTSAQ